jgi:hypothetical protein
LKNLENSIKLLEKKIELEIHKKIGKLAKLPYVISIKLLPDNK